MSASRLRPHAPPGIIPRVPTPEELHLKIARLYGRRDTFLRAAARAQRQIDALKAKVEEVERAAALRDANHSGKRKAMVDVQRLQVSKGKAEEDKPEGLQAKANAAGYTLRSLAEKLRAEGYRVSHPFLRQCLDGTSAIRKPLAERIEALTGFRASKAHWPKGWAREPRE